MSKAANRRMAYDGMLRQTIDKTRNYIRDHWQEFWSQRSEATQLLPSYIWRAIRNYLRGGSRQAAALAYYAIFSVFPLVLLLAIWIGSLVGPAVAQEQIANGLGLFYQHRPSAIFKVRLVPQSNKAQSSAWWLLSA